MEKKKRGRPVKVEDDEFTITVKIDNAEYYGEGKTALAALQAIKPPELDYISTGTVKIVHKDKSKEMLVPTMQMKRLLNPHNQEFLISDLMLGM